MGFAGASSALGMHYGSTGDSNRKMVQMLADMAWGRGRAAGREN